MFSSPDILEWPKSRPSKRPPLPKVINGGINSRTEILEVAYLFQLFVVECDGRKFHSWPRTCTRLACVCTCMCTSYSVYELLKTEKIFETRVNMVDLQLLEMLKGSFFAVFGQKSGLFELFKAVSLPY